jgi:hypothetical protein
LRASKWASKLCGKATVHRYDVAPVSGARPRHERELTLPDGNQSDGARVLVLGALNIDRTLSVPHLPVPGETLLSQTMAISCDGKDRWCQVIASRSWLAVAGFAG